MGPGARGSGSSSSSSSNNNNNTGSNLARGAASSSDNISGIRSSSSSSSSNNNNQEARANATDAMNKITTGTSLLGAEIGRERETGAVGDGEMEDSPLMRHGATPAPDGVNPGNDFLDG